MVVTGAVGAVAVGGAGRWAVGGGQGAGGALTSRTALTCAGICTW